MSWSVPPGQGERVKDNLFRLSWWPTTGVTKKATFEIVDSSDHALLRYIRTIHLRQHGETTVDVDHDASLDEIPDGLLATMRADGLTPAEEGEV